MKKLIVFLMVVFSSQFCFGQNMKIGVLFDQFASLRWRLDAEYMEKYFSDMGAETIIKVADSNLETQIKQAKELIELGVDALVVIAIDGTKCGIMLDLASKNSIPVIAYERPILDNRIAMYISYDNYDVGKKQAQSLVDNVSEGNIILINGPVSDVNAIQFRDGQLEILKPYVEAGKINVVQDIVLDSWSEMDALLKLHELSIDFSQINGVVSAADRFNNAIIEYLGSDELLKHIYTTGQSPQEDLVQKMEDNVQNMSVIKPIMPQAQKVAELTIAKLKGGKSLKLQTIKIGTNTFQGYLFEPVVLNRSNINEYKDKLHE